MLAAASTLAACALTVCVLVLARDDAGVDDTTGPQPPLQPVTALDQWHALRGGAPSTITPIATAATRPRVRSLPLLQYPNGAQRRIYRPRPAGWIPAVIVLHATGGGKAGSGFDTVDELGEFFGRGTRQASAHYGVGRDGSIARYVDESRAAFHVATPGWNDISIGIELLNDNSGRDPYPAVQLRAARLLVQDIAARHAIPLEGVVTHASVQPEDRRDPVGFPWHRWRASLLTR